MTTAVAPQLESDQEREPRGDTAGVIAPPPLIYPGERPYGTTGPRNPGLVTRMWRVARQPNAGLTIDARLGVFAGWEGCEGGELDLCFEVGDLGAAVAELGAGAGGLDGP
jgi:hypothetical protein